MIAVLLYSLFILGGALALAVLVDCAISGYHQWLRITHELQAYSASQACLVQNRGGAYTPDSKPAPVISLSSRTRSGRKERNIFIPPEDQAFFWRDAA
ncbi:MAG: hypothetical protein ACK5NN_12980 [Sphingomonadaceae bacterium]